MSRSLECVQGGMEAIRSPGATDQQMIKWPSDYMTQWPNEKKRSMTNLILIESFLQGALIPVTLGDSHPLGRTALYEGDSYVIQYAVRCRNDKEPPINWPVDLREGRSPDVIYFWQVLFLGTSFNKFLVLIDLRLSFHSFRNFELISIFSGFEQQQIWERSKRHPRRPGFQHQHYNFKIDIKGFIALLLCSWT